jgi:ABC-type Fe3+-hydroxamate transport system substrate-binding protein
MTQVKTVTDHLGQDVTFRFPPQRIVSLVPSQTELLFTLGLNYKIAGVTKFCVHPGDLVKHKTRVGGTKSFDFARIDQLAPDLIIGNKEENYCEGIEQLMETHPVWMSEIYSLDDALRMIGDLGALTDTDAEARNVIQKIVSQFGKLEKRGPARVLYLIWRKPYMAAGTNTFIDDMISRNGWTNAVRLARYPQLTESDIVSLRPDLIFLSSEPYPFTGKHLNEINALCPTARGVLVDGEMFSWYGSRLLLSCEYFRTLEV